MKRTRVIFGIILSLVLIFTLVLAACAPKAAAPEKPKVIKFGAELDLTGPYATAHRWWLLAYQDYTRYINDKGGISGIPVEVIWADMGFEVPRMLSCYERAKGAGVLAYALATTTSTDSLKAKIDKDKIPAVCASPGYSALVPGGYTVLSYANYEDCFAAYIDWFVKNWKGAKPPKLGILTVDSSYGRTILNPKCLDYVKSKGVEIVATEIIPTVPLDTTPNLLKIRDAGADFIFGNTVAVTMPPILRDMKKLGLKIPICGGPVPCDLTQLVRIAGELSEGVYVVYYLALHDEDVPGVSLMHEISQKYQGKVIKEDLYTYGIPPMQIMVEAVRLALEKVPYEQLTPAKVKEFGFDRMKDFSTGGITGPQTFEKGWAYGSQMVHIIQVQGGKSVAVAGWSKAPDVLGYKAYYDKEVAPLYK